MKTLVTGGAGCIGGDLAAELLTRGEQVVVVDNLSSGKLEHIEPLRRNSRFNFIEGDLEDPALVTSVMDGIGMVYHLAANPDVKFSPAMQPIRTSGRTSFVPTMSSKRCGAQASAAWRFPPPPPFTGSPRCSRFRKVAFFHSPSRFMGRPNSLAKP